jgi:hypothetical protein
LRIKYIGKDPVTSDKIIEIPVPLKGVNQTEVILMG